jgi:hypothetical protein
VINSSQRPLPDNTLHSQQTNIHAPVGFEPTILAGERPQAGGKIETNEMGGACGAYGGGEGCVQGVGGEA